MKRHVLWYKQLKKGMKFKIGKNKVNYSYIRTYKGKYIFAIRCDSPNVYQIINVNKVTKGIIL